MSARLFLSAALAVSALSSVPAKAETALFAGGCFWCVESDMDHVAGVTGTVSGYAGGTADNPTYRNYHDGGHREVVEVEFDPKVISYKDLVAAFLRTIDVTDTGGQFCDRGHGYSTAIHAQNAEQDKAAREAVAEAQKALGKPIVTPVEGAARFWPAEEYHQNYYQGQNRVLTRFGYVKQAEAYAGYRKGCGRDDRVRAVWGGEAYKGVATH